MMDDAQLLRRYVEDHSQEAFAELVRRHVNSVYFAALRRVGGDAHLADDVAQSVFSDLARKASTLLDRPVLAGWLHTSTRFAAAQVVRSEQRRRNREQEAQTMKEISDTPEPRWDELRPIIDEAMDELSEADRDAVLLRFFENRPLAEVGERFSLSADAARMRVDRALDKLRGRLARRGIVSTSAALAAVFVSQSGLAAPSGTAGKIVSGVFSAASPSAAASVAGWKILLGVVAGVCGIGFVMFKPGGERVEPDVVLSVVSAAETVAPPVATAAVGTPDLSAAPPLTVNSVELPPDVPGKTVPKSPARLPERNVPGAAAVQPTAFGEGSEFDALSLRQKNILKILWEHSKVSPDRPPARWGIKPGPESTRAGNAHFRTAANALRQGGLVGFGPKTGVVFLSNDGMAFCVRHAAELDAHPLPAGALRILSGDSDRAGGTP